MIRIRNRIIPQFLSESLIFSWELIENLKQFHIPELCQTRRSFYSKLGRDGYICRCERVVRGRRRRLGFSCMKVTQLLANKRTGSVHRQRSSPWRPIKPSRDRWSPIASLSPAFFWLPEPSAASRSNSKPCSEVFLPLPARWLPFPALSPAEREREEEREVEF